MAIIAAFLLSGFAGLMHEIVWSKLLDALIGTTAHAQAAVLVVYMGGLALGSVVFGRYIDRAGRPLRTYMILEYGIAAYCLALPLLLTCTGYAYVAIAEQIFELPRLKLALRFVLALLTVLLPAVLMGGTLPLLAHSVIRNPRQVRRRVAGLYAVNNFGAVLGAATAGFITLPLLGVYPSLFLAAALNVVAGTLVWPLARTQSAASAGAAHGVAAAPADRDTAPPPYSPRTYAVTLLALVLAGFAAMGYEVVFIRIIALGFGATTYAFTVMLMCFVTGIGLGSLLVAQLRFARPLWLLGVSQLLVVTALVAATPLLARFPYYVGLIRIAAAKSAAGFFQYEAGQALLCLSVLLVPTMCMGVSFPLVAAVQARHPRQIGAHVGATYAYNTLGNVLGILATTLVLLPGVGLLGAFHVNLALSALAGLLVLTVAGEAPVAARAAAVAGTAAVLGTYLAIGTGWTTPLLYALNHLDMTSGPEPGAAAQERAAHPSASFANWQRRFVVDRKTAPLAHLEEEAHASVLVAQVLGETVLAVNTKSDASTASLDMETQLLLAHAPLFMNPRARSLLVIGHGSGITLGSALRHPIERADVVEISAAVLNADFAFAAFNYGARSDPRVHVYLDDAQSFLNTVPRRYDVIISEPSNPWIAGIANLFTVEFFRNARAKLAPGGVLALWFHQYDQSDTAIALILRTLHAAFPHVTLFHEQSYADVVAIASLQPLAIDFAALEERFDEPAVRGDLARIGIPNLAALLSHHAVSPARFPQLLGSGPLNRVHHQRLEYESLRAAFLGEFSELVPRFNPLLEAGATDTDVLLDRYIAFRATTDEPIRNDELAEAAMHMSALGEHAEQVRASLLARAERAGARDRPPTRPARGLIPDPAQAGFYEAEYWGRRFAAANQIESAIAFDRRAMDLNPDAAAVAARLSDLLVMNDDLAGAAALIDATLARLPEDPRLLGQRGWLYIRAGRFAAARAALTQLLALTEIPAVHGLIANLFILEGRPAEAEPYFARAAAGEHASAAPPRLWQVCSLMARIVAEQGDRAAALGIVERALQIDPGQPDLTALRDAWREEAR